MAQCVTCKKYCGAKPVARCPNCPAPGQDVTSGVPGMQMVSALAVREETEAPDIDSMLTQLRSEVNAYREDEDFIAPQAGFNIDLTSSRIPKDLSTTAQGVLDSFGMKDNRTKLLLENTVQAVGLNRNTQILEPDVAAEEVSKALNWARDDNSAAQDLVDRVRRGEIVLTGSEVAVLQSMRDELTALQNPDSLAIQDSGWVVPVEQRHCTLCGQFVGELGSHACKGGAARDEHLAGKKETKKVKYEILMNDGTVEEVQKEIVGYRGFENFTLDQQKDMYLCDTTTTSLGFYRNGNDLSRKLYMLTEHIQKPMFGEATLPLPQGLRDAYLAQPLGHGATLVAELIDPPFERHELSQLIDKGGKSVAEELLDSPRARTEVLDILANSPSRAGADLAAAGKLPTSTISSMAASGDPMVRKQAAIAPNLPEADQQQLSTDPDREVRSRLLFGRNISSEGKREDPARLAGDIWKQMDPSSSEFERGILGIPRASHSGTPEGYHGLMLSHVSRNPRLLDNYVNDPDESLALSALATFPLSRHAIKSLGQVTSRKRLQAIHDALPSIWPCPSSPQHTEEHSIKAQRSARGLLRNLGMSTGDATKMVESVQKAIRERL